MSILLFLASVLSGALVGHAAWVSAPKVYLHLINNVALGIVAGILGWLLMHELGWYTGEWNMGLKVSAIFGYMVMSATLSGLFLFLLPFFRKF